MCTIVWPIQVWPSLNLKTWPKFCPLSLSLSMLKLFVLIEEPYHISDQDILGIWYVRIPLLSTANLSSRSKKLSNSYTVFKK
jgi:hypothetical protein